MADSKRTATIILFAVAVLVGIGASLFTIGEAFWDPPASGGIDERTDETYSLWSLDQEISRVGAADETNDSHWFAEALDGSGGITFLRAAPVVLTIGLVGALVGLILSLPEADRTRRIGGVFGLFSAFMGGATGILLLRGLALRAQDVLNPPGAKAPADIVWGFGAVLLVIFVVVLFIGGLMGLLASIAPDEHDEHHHHEHALLRLMCPDCNTITEAEPDDVPTCENCGFHSAI